MIRAISFCCTILVGLTLSSLYAHEEIIISGGPALRYYEDHKEAPHDKSWQNFIRAAVDEIKKIQTTLPKDNYITWMVYEPSYISRGKEDNEDYVSKIEGMAKDLKVNLVWFQNREEFVKHLDNNRTKDNKIARLEYFGHSNKRDWLFDYSNALDGATPEPCMFHIWDFHEALNHGLFTQDAFCQSWGCHSGEEFCSSWYKRTGIRMKGAIGKTDYSDGGLPFLSSQNGRWTE
jgi:hypothetical protein